MRPCNADIKIAEHLLQHCQLPVTLRWDMWPEQTPPRDKLYGNLEELSPEDSYFCEVTSISI